jgi:hypothetical protein
VGRWREEWGRRVKTMLKIAYSKQKGKNSKSRKI